MLRVLCFNTSGIVAQDEADADAAQGLVHEVYELVADNYLDARSGGFDPHRYTPAAKQGCTRRHSITHAKHPNLVHFLLFA